MRVLVLSQWYKPEPVFKPHSVAEFLASRGHHVEVVTSFPSYPHGRLYDGYRGALCTQERLRDVVVHRVWSRVSRSGSTIGRVANFGTFAIASCIASIVRVRRPDVAYVYYPPSTIGLTASAFGALRRVPYVLDVQDLWPESLTALNRGSGIAVRAAVEVMTRLSYRRAAKIVVLSPGFKAALERRGVSHSKIAVVSNWADPRVEGDCEPLASNESPYAADYFHIAFAGNLGAAQGLEAVLRAAAILMRVAPRIRITLIGSGVDAARLKSLARNLALNNVEFVERVAPELIRPYLLGADVLLVSLRSDPVFSVTIPSKTQTYMRYGKPIFMAVAGDAADLITRAKCGVACEPGNPQAIADEAMRFSAMTPVALETMGASGAAYYRERLSMEGGGAAIEQVLIAAARIGSVDAPL